MQTDFFCSSKNTIKSVQIIQITKSVSSMVKNDWEYRHLKLANTNKPTQQSQNTSISCELAFDKMPKY